MSEECEALKCLQQSHQMEVARLRSIQEETELLLAQILRYHLTNCIHGTVTAWTDEDKQAFALLGWEHNPMTVENVSEWIKRRQNLLGLR